MRAADLQAGASVKDDHHVFAQVAGLFFLALAQAFTGRHHEHNRDDAPGNAEHGEKGAKLVRPEGSQDVDNEIAHRHSTLLDATGTRKSSPAGLVLDTQSGGILLQEKSGRGELFAHSSPLSKVSFRD